MRRLKARALTAWTTDLVFGVGCNHNRHLFYWNVRTRCVTASRDAPDQCSYASGADDRDIITDNHRRRCDERVFCIGAHFRNKEAAAQPKDFGETI